MVPIIGGIILLAVMVAWGMGRYGFFTWAAAGETRWTHRIAWPAAGLAAAFLTTYGVNQQSMPASTDPEDLRRTITGRNPEHRWNVILVCMERMRGEFMIYVGNKAGFTPNLDRLAGESIFFENLYATGTRTVRGMEAITLNLPPTPGQAIIYRPEGTNLATTFAHFLDRGYDCAFLCGGDGRFDFMNRYFSTAGCRIADSGAWKKEDIAFKTAWGACDEDLFNKTIEQAGAYHAAGKPFHFFCMTTSNHRPFTFPAGRIDISATGKRKPAVQYADWAIGHLIEEARKRPWFNDTVFVIVADHCASSAGKTDIDVTKYRIPGMIYGPALVKPRKITTLASQIDVMPTLFGLLGWSHEALGYGHDLLAPSATVCPGRVFVSNYHKLGLLTRDGIAILGPGRKSAAHGCDPETGAFSQPGPPPHPSSTMPPFSIRALPGCSTADDSKGMFIGKPRYSSKNPIPIHFRPF